MGFFDTLKQVATKKPVHLKEPIFLKDFKEENQQIKDLENLIKVAPKESLKKIEEDIRLLKYGINGEKNIAYELRNSHRPIIVLYDLYLEYKGLKAQIDYVVIDQMFILVIECKNMVGEIEITNSGDFIRYFKGESGKVYKKEGIYSPIVQNERHVELIKDILKDDLKLSKNHINLVKHIVTIANPKTIVKSKFAKKEVKEHIIKHEQLISTMKAYHEANKEGYWFLEESMYKVAYSLLDHNKPHKYDYEKKYGISISDKVANSEEEVIDQEEKEINKVGETPLYKDLKGYRLEKSREEKIKPYFIYNNEELEAVIKMKPKTIDDLREIRGFGKVKCEKYGQDIIKIVSKY